MLLSQLSFKKIADAASTGAHETRTRKPAMQQEWMENTQAQEQVSDRWLCRKEKKMGLHSLPTGFVPKIQISSLIAGTRAMQ